MTSQTVSIVPEGVVAYGIQLPIQSLSSRVSMEWERDGGTMARSLRPSVRSKAPGSPRNGRAITRPTACSPRIAARAAAHAR